MDLRNEYFHLRDDVKNTLSHLFQDVEEIPLFALEQSEAHGARSSQNLKDREESLRFCTKCPLHIGRTKLVYGEGNPNAEICFIGASISTADDQAGLPFQGESGELLTKMISAMKLSRENVYLMNLVKCRGAAGKTPSVDEIEACRANLQEQLAHIKPRWIIGLGELAAQTLLRTEAPLSTLRGKIHSLEGSECVVTHHPESLLAAPDKKRQAWEDLQIVMKNRRS